MMNPDPNDTPPRGIGWPGLPGIGWPKKRLKNSCICSSSELGAAFPDAGPFAEASMLASMLTTAGEARSTRALKSGSATNGAELAEFALWACTGCCACCQQATSTTQLKKPSMKRETGVYLFMADLCL